MPQFKCLNYSQQHKNCILFYLYGTIINKKDLIKNCDGIKTPSECCWYKDINYAKYI